MVFSQIEHLIKMAKIFSQNDQWFLSQIEHLIKMANNL
jgi:uncharacterized protein HemX